MISERQSRQFSKNLLLRGAPNLLSFKNELTLVNIKFRQQPESMAENGTIRGEKRYKTRGIKLMMDRTEIDRNQAWSLLCEYTQSDSLRKHMLAVEACMRAYARKFGEDENTWGITGLLHDFDYEKYPTPAEHPFVGNKI